MPNILISIPRENDSTQVPNNLTQIPNTLNTKKKYFDTDQVAVESQNILTQIPYSQSFGRETLILF